VRLTFIMEKVAPASAPDVAGALEASERRFRQLADNAAVLIWRAGLDKLCDWFNKPWLDFTGRTMEQEAGFGWASGVHRDDYDRCVAIYKAAFDVRQPFTMDYRLRRHDGEFRWIRDNGVPFYGHDGEFAGYFGSGIDVTDHIENEKRLRQALDDAELRERQQQELQRHQELLINELDHRVKNTLATVQSIAAQTFREVDPSGSAQATFIGRLVALARAHDVLTRDRWSSAQARDVIELALEPFNDTVRPRLHMHGPSIRLAPKLTLGLAMAVHELCTNAVKHGALSDGRGQVNVSWAIDTGDQHRQFEFGWTEHGGPAVALPEKRGFGMRFLEVGLPREFDGMARLSFDPGGIGYLFRARMPADDQEAGRGIVALHR
jgi:PAS domain S-box-containing protein